MICQTKQRGIAMHASAARLRQALSSGRIVLAPGVYDLISARVADDMGFEALYMTGYGTVASLLGLPDAGLATYTEMLSRAAQIVARTSTPLVADADTGYGGLLNVQRTVQGYEQAGVAAIQIEDQEMPKKCGHTLGRRVVPLEDMVLKVRVAVESRRNPDTIIIARTDARTTLGLDEALRRGDAFAEAGADILFIESPESEEELRTIGRHFKGHKLLCNCVFDGRTPDVQADELQEMGFSIAIYPGMAHKAAAAACEASYQHLKQHRTQEGLPIAMYSSNRMHELMGFPDVWDFEKRWQQG